MMRVALLLIASLALAPLALAEGENASDEPLEDASRTRSSSGGSGTVFDRLPPPALALLALGVMGLGLLFAAPRPR